MLIRRPQALIYISSARAKQVRNNVNTIREKL